MARRSRWRAPREVVERARQLRQTQTPAEIKLWQRLRDGGLRGYRFRRQHAIGRFIADFYCPERRLVVEIDGKVHDGTAERDEERTRWLADYKRCTVVRFSNDEVDRDIESVLRRILSELNRPPL